MLSISRATCQVCYVIKTNRRHCATMSSIVNSVLSTKHLSIFEFTYNDYLNKVSLTSDIDINSILSHLIGLAQESAYYYKQNNTDYLQCLQDAWFKSTSLYIKCMHHTPIPVYLAYTHLIQLSIIHSKSICAYYTINRLIKSCLSATHREVMQLDLLSKLISDYNSTMPHYTDNIEEEDKVLAMVANICFDTVRMNELIEQLFDIKNEIGALLSPWSLLSECLDEVPINEGRVLELCKDIGKLKSIDYKRLIILFETKLLKFNSSVDTSTACKQHNGQVKEGSNATRYYSEYMDYAALLAIRCYANALFNAPVLSLDSLCISALVNSFQVSRYSATGALSLLLLILYRYACHLCAVQSERDDIADELLGLVGGRALKLRDLSALSSRIGAVGAPCATPLAGAVGRVLQLAAMPGHFAFAAHFLAALPDGPGDIARSLRLFLLVKSLHWAAAVELAAQHPRLLRSRCLARLFTHGFCTDLTGSMGDLLIFICCAHYHQHPERAELARRDYRAGTYELAPMLTIHNGTSGFRDGAGTQGHVRFCLKLVRELNNIGLHLADLMRGYHTVHNRHLFVMNLFNRLRKNHCYKREQVKFNSVHFPFFILHNNESTANTVYQQLIKSYAFHSAKEDYEQCTIELHKMLYIAYTSHIELSPSLCYRMLDYLRSNSPTQSQRCPLKSFLKEKLNAIRRVDANFIEGITSNQRASTSSKTPMVHNKLLRFKPYYINYMLTVYYKSSKEAKINLFKQHISHSTLKLYHFLIQV